MENDYNFNNQTNHDDESSPNYLITLLTCIFFGQHGIHRFINGKFGTGLLMFFTLGGLGFWKIIDLVLILTNSFRNKDGEIVRGKRKTRIIAGSIIIGYLVLAFSAVALLIIYEIANDDTTITQERTMNTVNMPDFSTMTSDEAVTWGEENDINIIIETKYSNDVENGHLIDQSVEAGTPVSQNRYVYLTYSSGRARVDKSGSGESHKTAALEEATSYLEYIPLSKQGLRAQLEYEGYSDEAIDYALENIETDWNENALNAAKGYLEIIDMTSEELHDQLIYEGFTEEQVQYALDNLE